jgi:hypothetical protein
MPPTERTRPMNRKPARHNEPIVVTPHDEQQFLEQLAAREESNAAALENWYARQDWLNNEWLGIEARERHDKAMGVRVP